MTLPPPAAAVVAAAAAAAALLCDIRVWACTVVGSSAISEDDEAVWLAGAASSGDSAGLDSLPRQGHGHRHRGAHWGGPGDPGCSQNVGAGGEKYRG